MKLVRLLANLGYGSRREIQGYIKRGAVTDLDGNILTEREFPPHDHILIGGEPLDPVSPLTILLNKPTATLQQRRSRPDNL